MFDDDLGKEIIRAIDKEADAHQKAEGITNESMFTLFLGDIFYARTKVGTFKNLPHLMWSGSFENQDKAKFIFMPNEANPFSFNSPSMGTIKPRAMDTDGGSIPRCLHGIKGLAPWDYGLGYIIHDWIFTAKNCNHQNIKDISFKQSATILAECIKTMMEVGFRDFDGEHQKMQKNEDIMFLIYLATSSSIAKQAWNNPEGYFCRI